MNSTKLLQIENTSLRQQRKELKKIIKEQAKKLEEQEETLDEYRLKEIKEMVDIIKCDDDNDTIVIEDDVSYITIDSDSGDEDISCKTIYKDEEIKIKFPKKKKKLCCYCNKPLRAIGNARSNGKSHNDWSARSAHKKCWLENL